MGILFEPVAVPDPCNSRALLRGVPLLAALSDEQCDALLRGAVRRVHGRGTTILASGPGAAGMHFILSGRAQVVMGDPRGRRVILAILGPGEHFGEIALLDGRPAAASVIAREPCEVLALERGAFIRCLEENAALAASLARSLAERLRGADERVGSLALLGVSRRVAKLLLEKSELVEGRRVVHGRISKQDIARMTGASRERVSRVMRDLLASGCIEMKGRSILLRDAIGAL